MNSYEYSYKKDGNRCRDQRESIRSLEILAGSVFRYCGSTVSDSLTLDKCEKIAFRRTDNVIIAKDGDSVIGFVGFGKYRNDELENAGLENAGEVFAIYILSQYYGKGIGYRLMQTALSELADHSKIAVWVLKENTKAIRFYERCGYRFDGREQIIELGSPVVAARMVLER